MASKLAVAVGTIVYLTNLLAISQGKETNQKPEETFPR